MHFQFEIKIMFNSVIEFWFKRYFFKRVLDDSRGNLNVKNRGNKIQKITPF